MKTITFSVWKLLTLLLVLAVIVDGKKKIPKARRTTGSGSSSFDRLANHELAKLCQPRDKSRTATMEATVRLASELLGSQHVHEALYCAHAALLKVGGTPKELTARAYDIIASASFRLGKFHDGLHYSEASFSLSPTLSRGQSLADSYAQYDPSSDKWKKAAKMYEYCLQRSPEDPELHRMLGLCSGQLGRHDIATAHLVKSMELLPVNERSANHYFNLGVSYEHSNMFWEAAEAFREAEKREDRADKQNRARYLVSRCSALKHLGRIEEAIQVCAKAVELTPEDPSALSSLGVVYHDSSKAEYVEKAIYYFTKALEREPRNFRNLFNLAEIFSSRHQPEESLPLLRDAVGICDEIEVSGQRSDVSWADAQVKVHCDTIRTLLVHDSLSASSWEGWRNLLNSFRKSLQLNYGIHTENTKGRGGEAIDTCAQALDIHDKSIELFTDTEAFKRGTPVHPFQGLTLPIPSELFMAVSERYAQAFCVQRKAAIRSFRTKLETGKIAVTSQVAQKKIPLATSLTATSNTANIERPLRVGYVSFDFQTSEFSSDMATSFSFHRKSEVEVICYALSPDTPEREGGALPSSGREKIVSFCSGGFHDISAFGTEDLASKIVADGIDVLVNLNVWLKGGRMDLFAMKPAPVTVSSKGYPASGGASFMDYIVGDRYTSPPELAEKLYTEKILVFPEGYSYFFVGHASAKARQRQAVKRLHENKHDVEGEKRKYGLVTGDNVAYVFCCFNLLYKIEPETFAIWMDILRQTAPSKKEGKGSVLWLLRHSSPVAAQKLRSRAEQYGVDPERIVLSDRFPSDEHLVVKSLCDAFLDTPMYNGHGTAADALWSGTPVITLPEERMASRVAAGLLKTAFPSSMTSSLIAREQKDYVQLAIRSFRSTIGEKRTEERKFALSTSLETSNAFDTKTWTELYEIGMQLMVDVKAATASPFHIVLKAP